MILSGHHSRAARQQAWRASAMPQTDRIRHRPTRSGRAMGGDARVQQHWGSTRSARRAFWRRQHAAYTWTGLGGWEVGQRDGGNRPDAVLVLHAIWWPRWRRRLPAGRHGVEARRGQGRSAAAGQGWQDDHPGSVARHRLPLCAGLGLDPTRPRGFDATQEPHTLRASQS